MSIIPTSPKTESAPAPKHTATTPWKPSGVLDASRSLKEQMKAEGKVLRWCRLDELERHMEEGWTPVQGKDTDTAPKHTLIDGTQLTRLVRKRNLVLCWALAETMEARKKYYENLTKGALRGVVKTLKEDAKDSSTKVYGDININGG